MQIFPHPKVNKLYRNALRIDYFAYILSSHTNIREIFYSAIAAHSFVELVFIIKQPEISCLKECKEAFVFIFQLTFCCAAKSKLVLRNVRFNQI